MTASRSMSSGSELIEEIVSGDEAALKDGVLATSVVLTAAPEDAYSKEWDLNGEKAVLGVRKN